MALHDSSYKHWDGVHVGVWGRRLVIASNGLKTCLQNKFTRYLIMVCWVAALAMALALFMIGQLLVPDSVVVKWVGNFNGPLQLFANVLTSWLANHPDISVRATQNLLFYYFCTGLMPLSIFALGLASPLFITRDLASNAIIVYSSKAVSRGDYFLGKFATAFGLVSLTWLIPVCAAWFMGNLLAPDWRFFWHSRATIGNILVFGLSAATILSFLVLGVSAISSKEKAAVAFWFMWWIIGGVVVPIAAHTQPWLRHISFSYDLRQIGLSVFRLGDDLQTVRDNIPAFNDMMEHGVRESTKAALFTPTTPAAIVALVLMVGASAWIIHKRVKPE